MSRKKLFILTLSIGVVIGGLGMAVLHWSKIETEDANRRKANVVSSQESNNETQTQTEVPEPAPKSVIELSEWGVEMTLPDEAEKGLYTVNFIESEFGGFYDITTAVVGCWDAERQQDSDVAVSTTVGGVYRYLAKGVIADGETIDPSVVGRTWEDYLLNSNQYHNDGNGDFSRRVGEYIYSFRLRQAPCGDFGSVAGQQADSQVEERVLKFRRDVFSSLQPSDQ